MTLSSLTENPQTKSDLQNRGARGDWASGGTRRDSVFDVIPSFGISSEISASGSSGIMPRIGLLLRETGMSSSNGALLEGVANRRVLVESRFSMEDKHSLREPAL